VAETGANGGTFGNSSGGNPGGGHGILSTTRRTTYFAAIIVKNAETMLRRLCQGGCCKRWDFPQRRRFLQWPTLAYLRNKKAQRQSWAFSIAA
jgi:hypothetical protein